MKCYAPKPLFNPLIILALLALRCPESNAAVVIYTDRAAFLAAAAGMGPTTLDFDSTAAGTLLPDPTTIAGITFSGYGTPSLIVDNRFDATSGANYLGADNAGTFNQFSYASSFDMSFASKNAIGLSIITAEVAGVTLFNDDIRLNVPGIGVASLNASAVVSVTPRGDSVFFVGLIDTMGSFTTARLEGSGALGFYNVDDFTTAAVPEPSVAVVMAASSPLLVAACWWRRVSRQKRPSSTLDELK